MLSAMAGQDATASSRGAVGDVEFDGLDALGWQRIRVFAVPPRDVAHGGEDRVPGLRKNFGDVAAEAGRRASNENGPGHLRGSDFGNPGGQHGRPGMVVGRPAGSALGDARELADCRADFDGMGFKREVAGVEEADVCIGQVTPEGLGAGWNEERIVLAPNRDQQWTLGAEVFSEFRVERDIACIVQEQVQLNPGRASSAESSV